MTKEEFLKLLPEPPDYEILTEVIKLRSSILVKNKLGVCKMWTNSLLKGAKPSFKNAIDKTSYRLSMYREAHGNNFEYPDFQYTNNNDKLLIICNRCGKKDTIIECNHLKKMTGCKTCDTIIGTPRMKEEDFLQRVKDTGSGIEILEERGGYHTPILCRNKYGLVRISPDHLLKGSIGSLRSAVDKTSYMIEQFKEKHNNKYTYPDYEYCGNRCEGKIQCPIHGEFTQLTDVHLMGSGCSACTFLDGDRINGYSRSGFIEKAKGRECVLYLVKMHNKNESFYKIGISSHTTEKRFKKSSDVKYSIDIIYELKSFDAGHIWDLEKEHHKKYKEFSYKPEIYFKGITECFSLDLPIEEILSYLEST